jgi:hypothetical protein
LTLPWSWKWSMLDKRTDMYLLKLSYNLCYRSGLQNTVQLWTHCAWENCIITCNTRYEQSPRGA